ncbi:XdhC/CoxI family protein [Paraflavitalea soli]|uniref:XdhC/CoxI family protein n=1 Tax=Paraflavitalea soli TaxID=2315862 RepID=A0A3B7MH68_9BACT|nr:XdhC/CoxI family protein [Paraflavitalea soli]AXY72489.1 XdhC/CoxI family protein [Paraflavitalea soli]
MKEIEDIIQSYKKAVAAGKKTALATVVYVEGSSYRRPGARMLVTEDGELTGAISGGCLEGDALRKALLAISQQKNKLVTYDTTDEDDVQFGVQLGCNGIVHILFEPIDPTLADHPVALLEKASLSEMDTVIVTLFSLSTYDGLQPGTCALYYEGGINKRLAYPALEPAIAQDVATVFHYKNSILGQYQLDGDTISGLIEWLAPPVSLVIAGAGNDVFPLVQMAHIAGWHTTVADGRPGHANRQRFPDVRRIVTGKPAIVMEQLRMGAQTAVLLMTHNYNYDKAMLALLLPQSCPYIGVLGPSRKMERMLQELTTETGLVVDDAMRSRIYGPTGLDIGAETSEEIALSVMAEIKMVMAGKNGQPLREKAGPIHGQVHATFRFEKNAFPDDPITCAINEQLSNDNPSTI